MDKNKREKPTLLSYIIGVIVVAIIVFVLLVSLWTLFGANVNNVYPHLEPNL